jgi:monovalent cation/hydrogen antiporter
VSGLQLLLVIVGAIAVTAYAQRRAAQPALVITLVGIAASFIPGIPRLELDTDVILGLVLPPLLYSAALSFSVVAFLRKLGPILMLGVGLVVATTFAVGAVGAWVVPGLTGGAAVVLGAVVAPPDAVSAVSIGRELGLRRRVLSVLTGESLVNDAAALTLFSVAVASVTGDGTFIDNSILLFLYSAAVGVGAGFVIAAVALVIRRALRDAALETVLGLVIPFAAFMLAEELEASGVLAVVTAGFLVGQLSVRFGYETRMQERQVWSAVDVLLEAFVFAYMGLQLRFVIDDLQDAHVSVPSVLGAGLLVLLAVIAIRPLWILVTLGGSFVVEDHPDDPAVVRMQRRARAINARAAARGRHRRREPPEPLTLREAAVVSWTGMRGVVTIAAAAGIPLTLADGTPFPGRPEIQAIAYLVAVGTLLIQGATLPWLIRRLGVQDPAEEQRAREQRAAAEVIAHRATAEVLGRFAADPPPGVDPAVVQRVAERFERRRERRADPSEEDPRAGGAAGRAMIQLTRDAIAAQRAALVGAIRTGEVDDEAARELLEGIDVQEAAMDSRFRNRL